MFDDDGVGRFAVGGLVQSHHEFAPFIGSYAVSRRPQLSRASPATLDSSQQK
jgi:hypothetical protein